MRLLLFCITPTTTTTTTIVPVPFWCIVSQIFHLRVYARTVNLCVVCVCVCVCRSPSLRKERKNWYIVSLWQFYSVLQSNSSYQHVWNKRIHSKGFTQRVIPFVRNKLQNFLYISFGMMMMMMMIMFEQYLYRWNAFNTLTKTITWEAHLTLTVVVPINEYK